MDRLLGEFLLPWAGRFCEPICAWSALSAWLKVKHSSIWNTTTAIFACRLATRQAARWQPRLSVSRETRLSFSLDRATLSILPKPNRTAAERLAARPDPVSLLKAIGLMETEEISDNTPGDFPPNATKCGKCSTKAIIVINGFATWPNCGDSRCGWGNELVKLWENLEFYSGPFFGWQLSIFRHRVAASLLRCGITKFDNVKLVICCYWNSFMNKLPGNCVIVMG